MFSASIPESELQEEFRALQKQLRDRWQTIDQFDQDDNDILVIPSISLVQDGKKEATIEESVKGGDDGQISCPPHYPNRVRANRTRDIG